MQFNFAAAFLLGPEFLAFSVDIVANQAVCRIQNGIGGAIILLQTDGAGIFELLLKFQDVGNGRTAELVNRLVIITYHTDILITTCKQRG